ncbi:redoxin domain-containing protein [Galbibacter pacificus]|uniref:Redoxin domain-containing protein n=1 Tax=Galbibacter pacificus TaxID=2996052 RepID=A0ABT6FT50_9FLAO|nr:redoxin domain-containing protein [Galbibacter pacificus]MDG3582452.1 redoxin domain-containing protein [Galbibacter pacificus]MDG3586430.1 redoxin domain-containing protein [Galbibacter pacificus]
MKTIIYIFSILLLVSCQSEAGKENNLKIGKLTLNNERPTPGDSLKITYSETAPDSIDAYFYYMVDMQAYPVDIHFKSAPELIGNVYVPDSATAIAFNFKKGDTYDLNNNKGYIIPLYNNEGHILPGSRASMAAYAIYKGSNFGLEIDKDSLVTTIENDIAASPEIKEKWNTSYITLTYNQNQAKGKKLINEYVKSIVAKETLTEEDYQSIARMYGLSRDKKKTDSIKIIAAEKFPNGYFAKESYMDSLFATKDLEEKTKVYEAYAKKFPNDSGWSKTWALQTMARLNYKNGNTDKFKVYASQIKSKADKAGMYNDIAWENVEKGENLDFSADISKSSLELVQSLRENPSSKPKFLSVYQYNERLESTYQMYADTYALILFKQGNLEEAIKYQKEAIGDGNSVDVNKRYIEFLIADKQYATVINTAENFIKKGKSNPEIFDYYKTAYKEVNGEEGLENKVAELNDMSHKILEEKIKNALINEDAPQFTLKDIDNNNIALSSLKGKVVILDFWATWCGPCKASFPEMQELVTKYKNNDNVVVLFVNTFENTPKRKEDVVKFISKNKYDFQVLLDNPIKNSRDFEVANQYGIRGIPTKIIIGPDGNIHYRSVGYEGDGKLIEEMDILINLLKEKSV